MVRDLRYLMLAGQPQDVMVVIQRLIKSSSYTDSAAETTGPLWQGVCH